MPLIVLELWPLKGCKLVWRDWKCGGADPVAMTHLMQLLNGLADTFRRHFAKKFCLSQVICP